MEVSLITAAYYRQAGHVLEPSLEVDVSRLRPLLLDYCEGLITQPFLAEMPDDFALHFLSRPHSKESSQ